MIGTAWSMCVMTTLIVAHENGQNSGNMNLLYFFEKVSSSFNTFVRMEASLMFYIVSFLLLCTIATNLFQLLNHFRMLESKASFIGANFLKSITQCCITPAEVECFKIVLTMPRTC